MEHGMNLPGGRELELVGERGNLFQYLKRTCTTNVKLLRWSLEANVLRIKPNLLTDDKSRCRAARPICVFFHGLGSPRKSLGGFFASLSEVDQPGSSCWYIRDGKINGDVEDTGVSSVVEEKRGIGSRGVFAIVVSEFGGGEVF